MFVCLLCLWCVCVCVLIRYLHYSPDYTMGCTCRYTYKPLAKHRMWNYRNLQPYQSVHITYIYDLHIHIHNHQHTISQSSSIYNLLSKQRASSLDPRISISLSPKTNPFSFTYLCKTYMCCLYLTSCVLHTWTNDPRSKWLEGLRGV